MRHAAGHLAPCRDLLGTQQVAGVFDHDDETRSAAAFNCRNRYGQMEGLARRFHFQLLGGVSGAPGAIHQVTDFRRVLTHEQIFQADGFARVRVREKFRRELC